MPDTQINLSSARRWTLLLLLSLGMVIAYLDRINISIVLAVKDFTQYFALTDADKGSLNSAFFWSYALAQIPAGWLVDRYGSKYPFAWGFLFWSLVSAATAMVGNVWQLFTLRLVLGLCESVVTPASMRWIRYHFEEKNRGLALGIYTTGSKIGSAIAPPLTAALIQGHGWRGMFIVMGIGCLAWLLFWIPLASNDRKPPRSAKDAPDDTLGFGQLLASPAMWGIIIGAFCYSYFYMFYMTWLPSYFVERRGLSLGEMSLYTGASFAGMAVIAAPAGWLADWMIRRGHDAISVRRGFTIAGMLFASTEVIGAFSGSNHAALFFAVISLAGLGLTTANYWALTHALMPKSSIGRVIGIQNCANSLSGIAASLLTGWLKTATGSYEAPMIAIVVFLMIGVVAYYTLARERFAPARIIPADGPRPVLS
jgi:ACS family D-galactonate transporter-like MFS transporter